MPKDYWQIDTEKLATEITHIASLPNIQQEEDLKMKVEPLLQNAFKKIGVDISNVRYEKTSTSYKGRQDAVYGYLTIEYKSPGKLFNKIEVKKTIGQLQGYLTGQATEFGGQKEDFLEKAVGVAIDGENIIFVRFTKGQTILQTPVPIEMPQQKLFTPVHAGRGFQVQGPYPINKSSISSLLIYARASARRPLTAKDLADVFAPSRSITQRAISELYSEIMKAQRRQVPSRIKAFFDEWNRIFGITYGQELEKAEKAAEETAKLYQMPSGVRLQQFLFSIHTFYAFLMKLIAIELVSLQRESNLEPFVAGLAGLSDEQLKEKLTYLESGEDFINKGIENFLEADFFSWYLDSWNTQIANVYRDIVRSLADFEPATPILEPDWTKDLLQNLYETIVPKDLRHSLGEYYTPDWLAGYVVDKAGYEGKHGSRFLDPACGSGTFLIQAINRVKSSAHKHVNEKIAAHIINNIVGFDINPLAVLTARTNYLIAFSKFIPYIRPITIPVYLCDSVLAPTRYEEDGELPLENTITFKTTKCDYRFPVSIQSREYIDKFTSKVDIALRGKLKPDNFAKQIKAEFKLPDKDIELLTQIYKQIKTLDDNNENGIWAKYIKNAFAPSFLGKFDFVIGNPPWIRWGYLSDDYRKATLKLWFKYGLFPSQSFESIRLGGGEKDFSMLFTYACVDNYLKDDGTLGFVITMEVFKSKGAGEGFRQFYLKNKDTPMKVSSMEDMVHLMPFAAANKTSIFFLQKGKKTTYPIPSIEWKRKKGVGRILPNLEIEKVLASTERKQTKAIPVNPNKIISSWQTARTGELTLYAKLKGGNLYKARRGISTDPYGVFWLRLKEVRPDGKIVIENMHERGEKKIKSATVAVESDLIFPAISGAEIVKFGLKSNFYLLVTTEAKTRHGYNENYMQLHYPLTYAYLVMFKDILVKRALYKKYFFKDGKPFGPFYSQFNVGEYTFAKYRVVWKRMASRMCAVVLSNIKTDFGTKPIVSTDTTSFIPFDNKEEAHYICTILNSDLVNEFIKSFSSGGRGFGAPSVIENFAIPKFKTSDRLHKKLAELSEEAHNRVKADKPIADIEEEINSQVKRLWNIK